MPREGQELEDYLERIRKTISETDNMVEQVRLRMQETDRMLESQGLTREQVLGFKFTDEHKAVVNNELQRRGMQPIDFSEAEAAREGSRTYSVSELAQPSVRLDADVATRQKKFGMMMKPFMI